MKRALALVFALPLLAVADPKPHATAHYDIVAEAGDPKDIGAMLEALHAQLTKYFGRAPKERMRVEIAATYDGFAAALRRDKQGEIKSGGYYAPDTKTAYLFVQPSEYYTRQLTIHEVTHQFHCLAATGNKKVEPFWYVEGLAEWFGMHNWDGKELKTCVVPALSLEDYPARALEQFTAAKDDVQGIGTGAVTIERPLAWALVHFLANRRPDKWKALASKLDGGGKPEKSWEQCIGKAGPEFAKELRTWIEEHQQPLRIVWISWQERGEAIEAKSQICALAVFRKPPESFAAGIEPVTGPLKAGLLLNKTGDKDLVLVRALEGKVVIVRRTKGVDSVIASVEAPAAGSTLAAARVGTDWVVSANEKELGRVPADGDCGLFAENCSARFLLKR